MYLFEFGALTKPPKVRLVWLWKRDARYTVERCLTYTSATVLISEAMVVLQIP